MSDEEESGNNRANSDRHARSLVGLGSVEEGRGPDLVNRIGFVSFRLSVRDKNFSTKRQFWGGLCVLNGRKRR